MAAKKSEEGRAKSAVKGLARRRAARVSSGGSTNETSRKPSTSSRKQTVEPGTWLGIPIGAGRYAYARVVALRPSPANVATVVVHRTEGTREAFDAERAVTPALRVPPFLSLGSWILERWIVLVEPTGAFEPLPSEIDFHFAPGTPGVWRCVSARTPGLVGGVLDPKVARSMVSAAMHLSEAREKQVRAAVKSDASWSIGDPDPEMVRAVDRYLAQRDR